MQSIKIKRRYTRKKNKYKAENGGGDDDGFIPNAEAVAIAAELDRQLIERFNKEELPRLQAEALAKRKQRPIPTFDFSPGYIRRMTSDMGIPTTPEEKANKEARLKEYFKNLNAEEATILYNGFVNGIFPEDKD
jgi:hypothetical protein